MGLAMAELRTPSSLASQPLVKADQPPCPWLAAYTHSRHESAVARQFQQEGLEALVPTYRRLSRWSDRIHRSLVPLFPGYVFVHVGPEERKRVLQTAGVVSIVCRCGRPVPLSDEDVQTLRFCIDNPAAIEPHPYLRVGQRVRVKHGPFQGWEGVLVEKKNATRLVITVEQIMKSVSIDLSGADVEAVG